MKPTELRIGNYVYNEKNEVVITDAIEMMIHECHSILFRYGGHVEYESTEVKDLRPVPLSEEWLKKFGFMKENRKMTKGVRYSLWYLKPFKAYRVHENALSKDWFYEIWFDDGHDNEAVVSKRTDYVHQLQNLYFALTGKELEIK